MSLRACSIRFGFGNVTALDGVSLDVPSGRCVALVGESGAGKTTLLRCAAPATRCRVADDARARGRVASERRTMRRLVVVALLLRLLITPTAAQDAAPVVVASKPFGESYLLAEMFAQLLEDRGIAAKRVFGLGSTEIIFSALRSGSIDVYPEYTGTGLLAVLHDSLPVEQLADPQLVFAHVASAFRSQYGVRWLPLLGFENTFAGAASQSPVLPASANTSNGLTSVGQRFRDRTWRSIRPS